MFHHKHNVTELTTSHKQVKPQSHRAKLFPSEFTIEMKEQATADHNGLVCLRLITFTAIYAMVDPEKGEPKVHFMEHSTDFHSTVSEKGHNKVQKFL